VIAAQGVCHRDLKLENILLDDCDPPHIKICDFGYSKVRHPALQLHDDDVEGIPDVGRERPPCR